MLDEKGTASALKKAWRGSGYTVVFLDGMVMVRSSCWGFRILEQHCPPKVLGMIVEHIGSLPEHEAYKCRKDNEAQTVMLDEEITFWNDALNRAENAADPIRRTSLTMDGYEIWQETAQLKVLPFDPDYIRIIDREHIRQGQVIRDESGNTDRRAYWEEFAGQMVVVAGIKYPDAGGLERLNGYPWLGENT